MRLSSERCRIGGPLENNHYAHYEKINPLDTIHMRCKPSEATLNYKGKVEPTQPVINYS